MQSAVSFFVRTSEKAASQQNAVGWMASFFFSKFKPLSVD